MATTRELVSYLTAHGITAWPSGKNDIKAIHVYTESLESGQVVVGEEEVTLSNPTVKDVRNWLGY